MDEQWDQAMQAIVASSPPPRMSTLQPGPFGSNPPSVLPQQSLHAEGLGDQQGDASSQSKVRHRKRPTGPGGVKYRRVRTGCYTCRERRVKCDETRPICDRCRKGKRDCEYADGVQSSSKSPQSINESTAWAELPSDVEILLKYHQENVGAHHYGFRYDGRGFFRDKLIEYAMQDESASLLYAIVAYAAYIRAFETNDDDMASFLIYYNKAIILLQQSLAKNHQTTATLLTMLLLTSLEANFGDWVNLMGHQRASHDLLKKLFTPQMVADDYNARRLFLWYIHYDIIASFLGGAAAKLDREWYLVPGVASIEQAQENPNDLACQFDGYMSPLWILGEDLSHLVGSRKLGKITNDKFTTSADELLAKIAAHDELISKNFSDPSYYTKSFSRAPPPSENDIADFRDPHFLFTGKWFPMNFIQMATWSLVLSVDLQISALQNQPHSPTLWKTALKICKKIEAIDSCDESPPGAFRPCATSLITASIALPLDKKYIDWCCRKLAKCERQGMIYSAGWRARASKLWNRDLMTWWIEGEEAPPLVLSIRDLVMNRAQKTMWTVGTESAQIRDLHGFFASMDINDFNLPDDPRGMLTDSEDDSSMTQGS